MHMPYACVCACAWGMSVPMGNEPSASDCSHDACTLPPACILSQLHSCLECAWYAYVHGAGLEELARDQVAIDEGAVEVGRVFEGEAEGGVEWEIDGEGVDGGELEHILGHDRALAEQQQPMQQQQQPMQQQMQPMQQQMQPMQQQMHPMGRHTSVTHGSDLVPFGGMQQHLHSPSGSSGPAAQGLSYPLGLRPSGPHSQPHSQPYSQLHSQLHGLPYSQSPTRLPHGQTLGHSLGGGKGLGVSQGGGAPLSLQPLGPPNMEGVPLSLARHPPSLHPLGQQSIGQQALGQPFGQAVGQPFGQAVGPQPIGQAMRLPIGLPIGQALGRPAHQNEARNTMGRKEWSAAEDQLIINEVTRPEPSHACNPRRQLSSHLSPRPPFSLLTHSSSVRCPLWEGGAPWAEVARDRFTAAWEVGRRCPQSMEATRTRGRAGCE